MRTICAIAVAATISTSVHAAVYDVIWSDIITDTIYRAPADGSGPVTVVVEYDDLSSSTPLPVDADGEFLYWTKGETLRQPLAGGPITVLHADGRPIRGGRFDVQGGEIFWGEDGSVFRAPADGSGTRTKLFDSNYHDISVAPSLTIFTTDRGTEVISKGYADGSQSPITLYEASDYPGSPDSVRHGGIAAVGDTVYWADADTDQILAGSADGTGPVTELYGISDYPDASGSINPWDLAVFGDTIVWVDPAADAILSAPLSGEGPVSVLYDIDDYPGSPERISPRRITVAAVPEPSSLAFLGIGSIGLLTVRRRRR